MSSLCLSELWQIYIFPIIIAIIGVYTNNRGAVFSIQKGQLRKCLTDLHKMKRMNLNNSLSIIIKCKNRHEFRSYSDLLGVENRLKEQSHFYINYLDDFEMIHIRGIKLTKCNIYNIQNIFSSILDSYHYYWVFTYKIFSDVVDSIRINPRKNDKTFIIRKMNNKFSSCKEEMNKIKYSMSSLNKRVKHLHDYIININHSFYYHSLFSYEFAAIFLCYKYNNTY